MNKKDQLSLHGKNILTRDLVLRGSDGFYYFLQEVTDVEYEEL